jgi:hypothetical protein
MVVAALVSMQSVALSEDSAIKRSDPLSQEPHLRSVQELIQMQNRIRADRLHTPEIVADTLKTDPREPILCVGAIVRAAIRGLGDSISKLEDATGQGSGGDPSGCGVANCKSSRYGDATTTAP